MKLIKRNISKNITKNLKIKNYDSQLIVDSFFDVIKKNIYKNNIKISNFGSFLYMKTSSRIGRNPKTGAKYVIESFNKPVFRASARLKSYLNWYNAQTKL